MDKRELNFSRMAVDLINGTFKAYSDKTPEQVNEAIRARFSEILPPKRANGKYGYRDIKNVMPQVFGIVEEILDVTINDAWRSDPFYRELVDARNLAIGEKNEFIIEDDTWITISKFSGNTWDTSREKVGGRRKISLDTEWYVGHVYDDFERFLTGAIDIQTLATKLTESFVRTVDSLIATAFNDAAVNLPSPFNVAAALTTADMRELIAKVRTKSGKNVRIMGTAMAVAPLHELGEVKYSEPMMRELHSTGRLAKWMGYTVVEIPQSFLPGTFEWAVDNDSLLIVPEGEKFIKFVDEGDTRSKELTQDETHDQVLSWQVQRKMGAAAIFASAFGKYHIV